MNQSPTPNERQRKFLRAMSHDFREPVNTLTFYMEEVAEHRIVESNHQLAKDVRSIQRSVQSLEAKFQNFYEAFKKTQNTLKFKKELDTSISRLISFISRKWASIFPSIHYLRFEHEYMDGLFVTDIQEVIDGLEQRHSALMRYLDADSTPEKTFTELRDQIDKVIRDLAALLERESIDRQQVNIHGSCYDRFDRALIILVFQNLLSNSVKYRDPRRRLRVDIGLFNLSGAEIRASIRAFESSVSVESGQLYDLIIYQDNGKGIPPDYQKLVFDPYFQLPRDKSSTVGGSGLGLAIVENVVAIHSGSVALESSEGRGTRFLITIPSLGRTHSSSQASLTSFYGQLEGLGFVAKRDNSD